MSVFSDEYLSKSDLQSPDNRAFNNGATVRLRQSIVTQTAKQRIPTTDQTLLTLMTWRWLKNVQTLIYATCVMNIIHSDALKCHYFVQLV